MSNLDTQPDLFKPQDEDVQYVGALASWESGRLLSDADGYMRESLVLVQTHHEPAPALTIEGPTVNTQATLVTSVSTGAGWYVRPNRLINLH